jgi:hypothetical protein
MIPLASNSAYPFPEAGFRGKAFWVPPVRQTGFLHQAAVLSVGTITRGCPRLMLRCPRCPRLIAASTRRASNCRHWCLFCACASYRVVVRTCTCFCGVLAQHIPMVMGCGHRQTQSEPGTLAHRGYSQPTSPERLPSLRLPCQLPASAMLSST